MNQPGLVARKKKRFKTSKSKEETVKVIAPRLVRTDEEVKVAEKNIRRSFL